MSTIQCRLSNEVEDKEREVGAVVVVAAVLEEKLIQEVNEEKEHEDEE